MSPVATPPAPPFLTAEWRWLAMLNYEVDPAVLRPLVPNGTELDAWNGVAYASVVGFLFQETRVFGVPVPLHRDFEEVNLRFYVRRRAPEGWRRGVVFVKEIVPRLAVTAVARAVYDENYVTMPMRHWLGISPENGGDLEYEWRMRRRWWGLRANVRGPARPLVEGSEEEFIVEHYWGYTRRRDGGTTEYRVEHSRWNVWRAESAVLDCDAAVLYGAGFAEALSAGPRSALVADGSPVVVRMGRRLTAPAAVPTPAPTPA